MFKSNPQLADVIYANHIVIAAHGSFLSKAGKCSWSHAVQVRESNQVIDQKYKIEWSDRAEYYGLDRAYHMLTDTRLEMTALIDALSEFGEGECDLPLVILSDDRLVIDGMTKWIEGWKANGWKNGESFIENADLWIDLDRFTQGKNITWVWMRGGVQTLLHDRADVFVKGTAVQGDPHGERLSV